jgi:hypothetical protein
VRNVYAFLLVVAAVLVGTAVLSWTLLDASAVVHDGGEWGIAAVLGFAGLVAALSWRYGRD